MRSAVSTTLFSAARSLAAPAPISLATRGYATSLLDSKPSITPTKWSAALHQDHHRQSAAHHDHDHHHAPEPAYHPPTGWLFGVRSGEKPETEGWEIPMAFFVASCAAFGVALAFRPNDRLDTWALEEARRRLEKEGILEDPAKKA